ncbi:HAD family hydrolase [Roseateles sp. NT4]|uniref:HAD family hydrolase n=1 Tax=Roseateles sp. NT4 TaxID=3453715 RepID=UPI003EEB132F
MHIGRSLTAWRLLRGALALQPRPRWSQRLQALEGVRLLCVDIFDTLLFQDPELDATVLLAVCEEIPRLLRREGVAGGSAAHGYAALASHRERLRATAGGRPEVPRREVYAAVFAAAGLPASAEALAGELIAFELALHRRLTWPHAEMRALLEAARSRGIRIVAVSDSYLGAAELQALLQAHGMPEVDRIYASCEHAADKFHGELFRQVLSAEGVPAQQALHVGDRMTADVWSPRGCGMAALHCKPAAAPQPVAEAGTNAAYRFGHDTLGPVFAAFARLLTRELRHRGWSRLAFVARDGDLLREVMRRWLGARPSGPQPALDYVYLSRRATALAAAQRIDKAALAQQLQIRAPGALLDRVLAFHDLQSLAVPDDIGDPAFQAAVAEAAATQTALLADYLSQERLGADEATLLVDIGWRASIQQALNRAFAASPGFRPLAGCYLGLWGGEGSHATGLLGDGNRRRSLAESAPWQAALLLEPLCRAPHGTVLGYERDGEGRVQPRLDSHSAARRAELEAQARAEAIRRGLLDHVARAAALTEVPVPAARLRRRAQRRLLRLAWLPRPAEVELLAGLVHTESHAADWAPTLVAAERPSPWRSPRRWLAGLASPWRGGYVAMTAGRAGGLAFLGLEALLIAFPGLGRRLQAWARRAAGV